jgi:Protein of unknown function with HXXEE motif
VRWLVDQWEWPYAAAFTALFLLVLAPLWWDANGAALGLVYLQLPVYMLHQLEEHRGDAFRRFVNERLAGGREALTPRATFVINSAGVWGIDIVSLWLAYEVEIAFGLIAVYLTAANALVHIAGAIAMRAYNPGLATAVALFVPVSVWGAIEVTDAADAGLGYQVLAIAIAVGVHAAIMLYLRARIAELERRSPARWDHAPRR